MIAILLVAVSLAAPADVTPPVAGPAALAYPALDMSCIQVRAMFAAWQPAIDAYEARDYAKAKTLLLPVIAQCDGKKPVNGVILTHEKAMLAQIDYDTKAYDEGLAVVTQLPRPAAPPAGSFTSWTALQLYQAKGDKDAIDRESAALAAAVEKNLTDPAGPFKGRKVESFAIGQALIDGYEITTRVGIDTTQSYFLIRRPGELPVSVQLLHYTSGAKDIWYLADMSCHLAGTVELNTSRRTYEDTRPAVADILSGKLKIMSGLSTGPECAGTLVTLGLDGAPRGGQ